LGEATGTILAIADGRLISVFGRIAAAFAARLVELFRLQRRTSKSIAETGRILRPTQ
jgi:hypothetical protein